MVAVLGIVWLMVQNRKWYFVAHPIFVIFTILTARLMFLNTSPEWLLVIFTALLCAWDLDYFIRRLNRKQEIQKRAEIEKRHLWRLLVVAVLGLIFGELIFQTSFEINLVWVATISIGAALGLHEFLSHTKAK